MADATAIRPIAKLFGKSYAAGEVIPAEVISRMTPQALAALVANRHIDVPGMEPADGHGANQHLKAKIEKLEEQNRKLVSSNAVLQQAHDDLAKRVSMLEAAGTASPNKSKREARKAVTQE